MILSANEVKKEIKKPFNFKTPEEALTHLVGVALSEMLAMKRYRGGVRYVFYSHELEDYGLKGLVKYSEMESLYHFDDETIQFVAHQMSELGYFLGDAHDKKLCLHFL